MSKSFLFVSAFIFFTSGKAVSQKYDWNKASQIQREKDNQAYIDARIPQKTKRPDITSNSSTESSYDRAAAADRKKREDAMNADRKKMEYGLSDEDKKARLIRLRDNIMFVPRIPENYSTLVNLAIDAGFSEREALDLNTSLNPGGKLKYDPSYRRVNYHSGPTRVFTAEERASMDRLDKAMRKQDSINKINEAIEKKIQDKLKSTLYVAMSAYSEKDYSNAAMYFDSSLAWKDLQYTIYYDRLKAAGITYRKLGAFEKSIVALLKHKYETLSAGLDPNPEYTREYLRYEASITAIYSGDFTNAISLGRVYEGNQFKYFETGTSDNAALNRSYCQFLLKTSDPKTQLITLPYYIDSYSDWSARLVRIYYSLKTDDKKYVKEQMKLFARENPSEKFEGDVNTKLAGMLFFESKKITTSGEVPVQALYLLDLAIDLLPGNKEFLQTRYNLNILLKRTKFAEADAVLLGLK